MGATLFAIGRGARLVGMRQVGKRRVSTPPLLMASSPSILLFPGAEVLEGPIWLRVPAPAALHFPCRPMASPTPIRRTWLAACV
jgi:hypothetical protein